MEYGFFWQRLVFLHERLTSPLFLLYCRTRRVGKLLQQSPLVPTMSGGGSSGGVAENLETLRSMFPDHAEEQLWRALDITGSVEAAIQRLLDGPVEVDQDQARTCEPAAHANASPRGAPGRSSPTRCSRCLQTTSAVGAPSY